jgi:short-subunit dehydrogenase
MATETKEQAPETGEKTRAGLALITGASSGIGAEFARQLARKGYSLVLVARRQDRLEERAADHAARYGIDADVIAADLATPEGVAAVAKRLAEGDVDMLVNSAGFGTLGEFAGLPQEREMEEIDVNVKALVALTHAALGPMVERGSGTIINLGSVGSFTPCPYMSTYTATKAFVLFFSESVHEEVRGKGVTVTCLCPGFVKSGFQQVAGQDLDTIRTPGELTPKQVVAAALKGAAAGRAIVVPGTLNGLMAQSTRLSPRFLIRKASAGVFRENALGKHTADS